MILFAAILRLFGFVQWAFAIEQSIAKKIKAQDVANMPMTKQEITDAADQGKL